MRPNPPTNNLDDLIEIVRTVRVECPWDREQTHETIAPQLIEEAYETREAIAAGDDPELRGELGDLLLHVVMHAIMAEERSAFTLDDVVRGIAEKMVRRHPHIYGDGEAADSEAVKLNWERMKMTEGRVSILDGMPIALPALQRAARVQEKVAGVGFDWPERADVWNKVREEIEEFAQEAESGASPELIEEEFGDLLFTLVNIARWLKIKPEEALQKATGKFIRRFRAVEERVKEQGLKMEDVGLEGLDLMWDEVKRGES